MTSPVWHHDDMSTTIPMFPLGSALVPGMVLPLHVFEARYRALVTDVLAADGIFGVVMITHGHEVGGGDRRTRVGTTAQIVDAQESDDGRWGVMAVGRSRIRVIEWLPDDPYPQAVVRDWPDEDSPGDVTDMTDVVDGIAQRLVTVVDLAARLGIEVDYPQLAEDPATAGWQAAFGASLGAQDIHDLLICSGPGQRLPELAAMLDRRIDVLRFQVGDPMT